MRRYLFIFALVAALFSTTSGAWEPPTSIPFSLSIPLIGEGGCDGLTAPLLCQWPKGVVTSTTQMPCLVETADRTIAVDVTITPVSWWTKLPGPYGRSFEHKAMDVTCKAEIDTIAILRAHCQSSDNNLDCSGCILLVGCYTVDINIREVP